MKERLGNYYVTQHALSRLRLRWPAAVNAGSRALVMFLVYTIETAEKDKRVVNTPGGAYVPFSLAGKKGFLVIRKNRVVTVLEEQHCPEVKEMIGDIHGQI